MKTAWKVSLAAQGSHALHAALLGVGLLIPLLGTLELLSCAWMASSVLLAVLAAVLLLGSGRMGKIALWGGALTALAVWMLFLGGMSTLTETLKAMVMQYGGYVTARLYAHEIAVTLAVVLALLAWGFTHEDMGVIPSLLVLLVTAVLLWAMDCEQMTLALAPAALSVMLMAAGSSQRETPLRRVLPLALILTVVSGALTLGGGVTVEPMRRAAEELRERIEDYLFFTEPRNVFSLAAEGYYPQGQNQLGGPAQPNENPVMIVSTPGKTYLRGAIKNEYTGRSWYDTTGGRRYLWLSPRWYDERTLAFDMELPSATIRSGSSLLAEELVTVQMVSGSASSLFVPQRVRNLSTGGDVVPYFNRGSEIFATRDLAAGDIYMVTVPLMQAGDAGLDTIINACAAAQDAHYASIAETYTQLPAHLQEMVYELAAEITAHADTPYEKAMAIQRYLQRSYRYTLDVAPQPENIDFVTNFLFNSQEGYCTYFASAMTVLCRMNGLPARYVEGYLAEPDANGVAYVTGRNGHAWTEVYFSGFGWLTFDATPVLHEGDGGGQQQPDGENDPEEEPSEPPEENTPEPTDTPEPDGESSPQPDGTTETPTPEPQTSPEPEDAPTPTPAPDDRAQPDAPQDEMHKAQPPAWLWWLLLLLLAMAACALRVMMTMPERASARAKTEEAAYGVWVQAVYDALCVMGLAAKASESPIAYTQRLDATGRMPVRMKPLGRQMSMVFYGKVVPEQAEINALRAAWKALTAQQKPLKRMQMYLRRAFMPMKKRSFAARA